MTVYTKCIHNGGSTHTIIGEPISSIVVNPVTFERLCGCCGVYVKDFPKSDDPIEAYNRAMKGIKP